jgi:hypothetical protein
VFLDKSFFEGLTFLQFCKKYVLEIEMLESVMKVRYQLISDETDLFRAAGERNISNAVAISPGYCNFSGRLVE